MNADIHDEIKYERDLQVKLALLQAAAILRGTLEFTTTEAVDEADALLAEVNRRWSTP